MLLLAEKHCNGDRSESWCLSPWLQNRIGVGLGQALVVGRMPARLGLAAGVILCNKGSSLEMKEGVAAGARYFYCIHCTRNQHSVEASGNLGLTQQIVVEIGREQSVLSDCQAVQQ